MSQRQMLFIVAIVAAMAVDCARQMAPADEPAAYSYSFAIPECAPWDGPAVALYLLDSPSDAVPPVSRHVRVAIWKDLDELAHHTFRWPLDQQTGAGAQCLAAESCEPAIEGQIAFGNVDRKMALEATSTFGLPTVIGCDRHLTRLGDLFAFGADCEVTSILLNSSARSWTGTSKMCPGVWLKIRLLPPRRQTLARHVRTPRHISSTTSHTISMKGILRFIWLPRHFGVRSRRC